jgi:hypothetical protein
MKSARPRSRKDRRAPHPFDWTQHEARSDPSDTRVTSSARSPPMPVTPPVTPVAAVPTPSAALGQLHGQRGAQLDRGRPAWDWRRLAAGTDLGPLLLSGALAWCIWGVVHVLFLSGMRNRGGCRTRTVPSIPRLPSQHSADHGKMPLPMRTTVAPSTEDFPLQRVIGTSL